MTTTGTFAGRLYATGNGTVVNAATLGGALVIGPPTGFAPALPAAGNTPASVTNTGSAAGGLSGYAPVIVNTGTLGSAMLAGYAVQVSGAGPLTFTNPGTVVGTPYRYSSNFPGPATVALSGQDALFFTNSGTITGNGVSLTVVDVRADQPGTLTVQNGGTITGASGSAALTLGLYGNSVNPGAIYTVAKPGTISGTATGTADYDAVTGIALVTYSTQPSSSFTLANTGVVGAVGGSRSARAVSVGNVGTATLTNATGGVISASGSYADAVSLGSDATRIDNAGLISAAATQGESIAINAYGGTTAVLRNTGMIAGQVYVSAPNASVDNAGIIAGSVSLGGGDDTFVQRAGGIVTGLVNGGAGANRYVLDATGGTAALAAGGVANFASVTQTGTGTGVYSGIFGVDTINLAGGTLSVAGGQTLSTTGATTVTGAAGSGNLTVTNAGAIAGGITLADGNDTVVNNGTIAGRVQLGAGDDTYVEGVGSKVGGVDGGSGTNLYRVVLAGDRTGVGARSNFQNLAVDGSGTLSLTLDQSFGTVALNGTGLSLTSGSYSVDQIVGSGGTGAQVTLDRDVGLAQLGSGNDTLSTGVATLAGRYDGGAGTDTLRLTNVGPVAVIGVVTGFETVALTGSSLTIAGTLGSTGASLAFASGDKSVMIARGGTLAGTVDLGAGNDNFRLAAGGMLAGTVSGGAGSNVATLELTAGDITLRSGTLTNFQRLTTEGAGTLTLAGGGFAYDTLAAASNLTVAADATLATRLAFDPGDNRLVVAGGFAGSVDGGAGTDSIDVSGGSAAAPVAFSSIANVEAYRMSGGFATVSGAASLGAATLTGGRLVGLAGSTLTASTFAVGPGATFGTTGTVNGNVTVAGVLSPGASPGTMTVNGNVALVGTSVSLFEITPAVPDKLVVNGAVSIASGATLQLVPTGTLTPGTSLDLLTATGGISGSFTTITKPASLFGFVVQDANRIRLLGEFLNDPAYTGQVRRSVDYVNTTLVSGQFSAALLAAVPLLLSTSGSTNAAAFAQLTPEAYAAAHQIGTENGLTLADAARGDAFAPSRDTPGLYTFANALGSTRTLESNDGQGTTRTSTNGYGFLGGIGVAGDGWSVGAFGGYLNDLACGADREETQA